MSSDLRTWSMFCGTLLGLQARAVAFKERIDNWRAAAHTGKHLRSHGQLALPWNGRAAPSAVRG